MSWTYNCKKFVPHAVVGGRKSPSRALDNKRRWENRGIVVRSVFASLRDRQRDFFLLVIEAYSPKREKEGVWEDSPPTF